MAKVRYIVDDVPAAVAFYAGHLGFEVAMQAEGFAALDRDDLRLFVNATGGAGGASQPTADGRRPEPGGWNRIQLPVDDVRAEAARLRGAGVPLRGDVITGRGGSQVLLEDPAGNLVELFEAVRPAAAP
jgi:catechol 2,3-dioxygenase-like lactoylglutathione lyase family enzyme